MRQITNTGKHFHPGSITLPILAASLDAIFKKVDTEGIGKETFIGLADSVRVVTERFSVGPEAAVLLAAILERTPDGGCGDDDLSAYIGCSNIEFIGFRNAVRELEDKGVVCQRRNGIGPWRYVVGREALMSVERDSAFVPQKRSGLTAEEFFSRIRGFFNDLKRDFIDGERLLEELTGLIGMNQQLAFCRRATAALANPAFGDTERRIFLALCHRYANNGEESVPISNLLDLTDYSEDPWVVRRVLSKGQSDLQISGLVTFGGERGFQESDSLALSGEVKREFFREVTIPKAPALGHRDLVPCRSIPPRKLFYVDRVASQIRRLEDLLAPANFQSVRQRLKEMGMRQGFAILFSGGAGCGKTAEAYELARRTGRDVFAVDMSKLKSKWVGDSEKAVRGLFNTYQEMCRTREIAPILLFNEADAIFSRRLEAVGDSVDQMMNSLQNICLEAIEKLDGILIATTNLASNFCDEAFARRFIFKVEFNRPDPATRAKIWQSMLDGLSDSEATVLASRYDFSGGNIENVARKAAVGYVLGGKKADLDELLAYCDEERLSGCGATRKIGF